MKKKEQIKAAALKYERGSDNAPRVVASGKGEIARKIIEIAREHGIPIHHDPDLVEVLTTLELYEEIPPELYRAVAEILAYVYLTTKKEGSV
ncbi:MAG: flagellar biosynthesis protein FlhB [Nitrospirae bacterium]|nr:MAG: flagellar biosynthesis protein FlhB [Nitrospirota bacterium]